MPFNNPRIDTISAKSQNLVYYDDNVVEFTCSGSPDGNTDFQDLDVSSIAHSDSGEIYVKTTPPGDAFGWILLNEATGFISPPLNNLQAWYRADKLASQNLIGTAIASWPDELGKYPLSQSTGVNRPTIEMGSNGFPAVRFLGSIAQWMENTTLSVNRRNYSIFVVMNPARRGDQYQPISFGSNEMYLYGKYGIFKVGGTQNKFDGADNSNLPAPYYCSWHQIGIIQSNTASTLYMDSITKSDTAMSAGTVTALRVGIEPSSGNLYYGDIAEILIYSRALNTTERIRVQQYLNFKYNLNNRYEQRNLLLIPGNSLAAGSLNNIDFSQHLGPLTQKLLSDNYFIVDKSIGGMNTTQLNNSNFTNYLASYSSRLRKCNIVLCWEGSNEISSNGYDGTLAYNQLTTYLTNMRNAGFKAIVATVLPRENTAHPEFNVARNVYNGLVRTNWRTIADGIADFAGDTRIGDDADCTNLTYYYIDEIHLKPAAYTILAEILSTAVERLTQNTKPVLVECKDTTGLVVTTSGTSETDLHSVLIPQMSFESSGDRCKVVFGGFGTGAGLKTIKIYVNGSVVASLTTIVLNNEFYRVEMELLMDSDNAKIRGTVVFFYGAILTGSVQGFSVSPNLLNDLPCKITGQCTADSMNCFSSYVEHNYKA